MRKVLLSLAVVATLAGTAQASDVGFNVGINIGSAPRVYAPPPVYYPPPAVIEERPEFVQLPDLGFSAAVGIPYDLFYVSGRYYLAQGNAWYSAPCYNGPWVSVRYQRLPWGLRKYPFERVRYYRDVEYRRSCDHDDRPAPGREWREYRRYDNERWKEARRWERRPDRGRWHDDDDD